MFGGQVALARQSAITNLVNSQEKFDTPATSLWKHVYLKKLRDALESLKGCMTRRNKDDVKETIAMVEALAVQLTQREGKLIQEKLEVKKLATFLKQASENRPFYRKKQMSRASG
ncbi:hypothetical protein ES288_D08G102400v1 [Gossypium darwinii]|uniref:Stomatal closure-related actin-binding protein coiled-coil domain-containing protein n=1 Tax=Gossypium darwinii TaxID=34276 RepID=A0A5D2BKX5_GOSDA|nr:hypothetical protein ES288_D08G102400v1 [Gossypium darwinii]